MLNNITVNTVLNALIPISRFNKGEANKIFDEVKKTGYKIVVKNNAPACVLITPDKFQEMLEELEDYHLLNIAKERMANAKEEDFILAEDIYKELGITDSDLKDVEVEVE